MTDNRNTILAVILSGLVLIGWQYFYNIPQMEKQRAQSRPQSELAKPAPQAGSTADPRDRRRHRARARGQRARGNSARLGGARGRAAIPRLPPARASRSTPRGSSAAFR